MLTIGWDGESRIDYTAEVDMAYTYTYFINRCNQCYIGRIRCETWYENGYVEGCLECEGRLKPTILLAPNHLSASDARAGSNPQFC